MNNLFLCDVLASLCTETMVMRVHCIAKWLIFFVYSCTASPRERNAELCRALT